MLHCTRFAYGSCIPSEFLSFGIIQNSCSLFIRSGRRSIHSRKGSTPSKVGNILFNQINIGSFEETSDPRVGAYMCTLERDRRHLKKTVTPKLLPVLHHASGPCCRVKWTQQSQLAIPRELTLIRTTLQSSFPLGNPVTADRM